MLLSFRFLNMSPNFLNFPLKNTFLIYLFFYLFPKFWLYLAVQTKSCLCHFNTICLSYVYILCIRNSDLTSKARRAKAKINKWDYTNLKRFRTVKKINNALERQSTEKKIFANHMSDQELIWKYVKNSYINNKRTNNQTKKWDEVLNRHFPKICRWSTRPWEDAHH